MFRFFKKRRSGQKVGILGGTFNPIHIGHLSIAETALVDFNMDKVIFIPCYIPPHKISDMPSGKQRLELVELAVKKYANFEASDLELKKGGVSYSVETMKAFRKKYPMDDFFFIIGADSLCNLHTWRDIYTLLELCTFVTVTRPGYVINDDSVLIKEPWKTKLLQNVSENCMVNVSSSEIREKLNNLEDVGYMLPPDVEAAVISKGMYVKK